MTSCRHSESTAPGCTPWVTPPDVRSCRTCRNITQSWSPTSLPIAHEAASSTPTNSSLATHTTFRKSSTPTPRSSKWAEPKARRAPTDSRSRRAPRLPGRRARPRLFRDLRRLGERTSTPSRYAARRHLRRPEFADLAQAAPRRIAKVPVETLRHVVAPHPRANLRSGTPSSPDEGNLQLVPRPGNEQSRKGARLTIIDVEAIRASAEDAASQSVFIKSLQTTNGAATTPVMIGRQTAPRSHCSPGADGHRAH